MAFFQDVFNAAKAFGAEVFRLGGGIADRILGTHIAALIPQYRHNIIIKVWGIPQADRQTLLAFALAVWAARLPPTAAAGEITSVTEDVMNRYVELSSSFTLATSATVVAFDPKSWPDADNVFDNTLKQNWTVDVVNPFGLPPPPTMPTQPAALIPPGDTTPSFLKSLVVAALQDGSANAPAPSF